MDPKVGRKLVQNKAALLRNSRSMAFSCSKRQMLKFYMILSESRVPFMAHDIYSCVSCRVRVFQKLNDTDDKLRLDKRHVSSYAHLNYQVPLFCNKFHKSLSVSFDRHRYILVWYPICHRRHVCARSILKVEVLPFVAIEYDRNLKCLFIESF